MNIKKDVFITSTLKSERNRNFNPLLCEKLETKWIICHLPQRDTKQNGTELDKFNQNIDGINNSKKVIAIWFNESINWWLEIWYTFGSKKEIILLTDKEHISPTMSLWMYNEIFRVENLNDLDNYIDDLINIIKK